MTTAFVRLQHADLAQMATRLNSLLTPEGAQAWYSHDVAELLQEVVALRQDLHDVRACLAQEMPEAEDESLMLGVAIAQWKECATGIYEKAQFKKLRAEVADLRRENREQSETIHNLMQRAQDIADEREQERLSWDDQRQALADALDGAVATATQAATDATEARQAQGELQQRLDAALREQAIGLMASEMQVEELKTKARTALMQVIETTLS